MIKGGSVMNVALVYMNNECNIGRGAGEIAGAIIQAGHHLTFFDTFFTPVETVVERVTSEPFDVLMISTMTMLFPDSVKLACMVKEQINTPILMGGIHPTIAGGNILAEHPEIDYLCIGEGESMVVEFLDQLNKQTLYSIKNLAYRQDDGSVQVNPHRSAEDLAELSPFPWHLYPEQAVLQGKFKFLYVNASRGCPYNCTYCCNNIYLNLYHKSYLRFRPIEHIIDELKYLQDTYSPGLFYFGDEMILSKPDYALSLFRTIKEELGIPYGCMARVEYMTPEIVQVLSETGCQYIGMGVECGDEEFRRKHLFRRMSNSIIEEAFKLVKNAGIFVTSFNMIGYPFDFDDRLSDETLKLNQKIDPDFAQISIFYPFPGTNLYQRCVDLDLIDQEKMARTKDYFDESVLKGVSVGVKKKDMDALLNPNGLQFRLKGLSPFEELQYQYEELQEQYLERNNLYEELHSTYLERNNQYIERNNQYEELHNQYTFVNAQYQMRLGVRGGAMEIFRSIKRRLQG
jgi:anaerobic magnesium-protoporphyrin IX monomethyl ester cyclase